MINNVIQSLFSHLYYSFIELSEKKIVLEQKWQDNKRTVSPIELCRRSLGTRP